MLWLLRLERKQTNLSNPFRIRIFLFLSYSFGIEAINTFIHSREFPRKPYLIPHQNGQSVYPFADQNGPKTLPKGTNINHKGLHRTANEYAEELRIYEDLISKNDKWTY